MNAVEIEEAVSALAERPFEAAEFPLAFLEAFGNKATTIKRLRTGASTLTQQAKKIASGGEGPRRPGTMRWSRACASSRWTSANSTST